VWGKGGAYRFWWGNLRERDHLEDLGIDRKWIFKKWDGGMDWIDMAHDRDKWQAVVNVVMNLGDSIKCREFFLTS
jgi:hypothetical protein